MSSVLDRMGYKDVITVHGFRSTFRDYIAEETRYENIVAEMALAQNANAAWSAPSCCQRDAHH